MFIRVSPPSRLSDRIPDAYVPLDAVKDEIDKAQLGKKLGRRAAFNSEDLFNERISTCPDPGSEHSRGKAMDQINSEVGRDLVELLNILQPHVRGHDIHTDSTFELVDERPEDDGDGETD